MPPPVAESDGYAVSSRSAGTPLTRVVARRFGVEAPLACAFMYYLYQGPFAATTMPATETDKLVWVLKRGFLAVFPTFIYIWGCMRAFDNDTRVEDPLGGHESVRWQKFQKILTNNTEQVLMFIPAIISAALNAGSDEEWKFVAVLFYTFCLGRLLFGAGYFVPTLSANNPLAPFGTLTGWARSPGMNLTCVPASSSMLRSPVPDCASYRAMRFPLIGQDRSIFIGNLRPFILDPFFTD